MSQNGGGTNGLGKERITAFSDGVFAIAVTLLVLDIKVPDPAKTTAAQLPGRLLHLWPELFSYALSFVIIGVFWVAHHLMLHPLKRADRTLLWINNLFLMCVAFIPFTAGLLGQYRHDRTAVAMYGASLVLTCLSLQLLWTDATRSGRLTDSPIDPWLVRTGHVRILGAISIYLAAIFLSWISPIISLALYWLVPILYAVLQSRDDRRQQTPEANPSS
jgi:uncharacterized membrane protein